LQEFFLLEIFLRTTVETAKIAKLRTRKNLVPRGTMPKYIYRKMKINEKFTHARGTCSPETEIQNLIIFFYW